MSLTGIELIGHLAFFLTAISFWLKDMLLLRYIAVASALVGITYNYSVDVGPLWLPIFWLSVFTFINVWRIVGIYRERYSVSFTDDERELYETVFRDFSPVEFMKLMRSAEWRNADKDAVFATEGQPVEGLYLLFNGKVRIERGGAQIGQARHGALIGEMSFIQGGNASATVTAMIPCRYVYWPEADLRSLLRRNPSIDLGLKSVFGLDLTRKLADETSRPIHISEAHRSPEFGSGLVAENGRDGRI